MSEAKNKLDELESAALDTLIRYFEVGDSTDKKAALAFRVLQLLSKTKSPPPTALEELQKIFEKPESEPQQ